MNKITIELHNKICEMYLRGISTHKIAKEIGCSVPTVCRHLEIEGIVRRSPEDAKRIHTINTDYFLKIDSHEKAQILGFIAADGNVSSDESRLNVFSVTLQARDRDYVQYIKNMVGYSGPLKHYKRKRDGREYIRLAISSKKFRENLINIGITPRKSLTLPFPSYDKVPREFICSYILGYFEGDGTIGLIFRPYPSAAIKIAVTHEFALSLKNLLKEELNIECTIFLRKKYREEKFVNMYTIEISGNQQVMKFCKWIYSANTWYMGRKMDRYKQLLSFYDENGNFIRDDKWKEKRMLKYNETRRKRGTKPGTKLSVKGYFISPEKVIYQTNNIQKFALEFSLRNSDLYLILKDQTGLKQYKGWTKPTQEQIDTARQNNTLVEKIY